MIMGFGKTEEAVLATVAMRSERIGSATIYYNGAPITNASGYGFDTQPFDDYIAAINVGTVQGALATVYNAIYESDTDDPSAATALSGADFTDVYDGNDECFLQGSVKCKDTKRYHFIRTETAGEPLTVDFSAQFIGGNSRTQETGTPLEFDV